ncbi:MAG: NAD(P)-binding protein [Caulobacteraceae bacterium]|nr:NAD(P)-binding protein [Caulobacteraceae bacterium]
MPGGKQKIAVLGGGVGALTAAFYLTEEPGWEDRYEITVYQQGWRLGGKCASGHDMRPGYGHRIYEHGLHIFAGFYDQAFHMLNRAYEALERPDNHPNKTVWDAFTPQDTIAIVDPDQPLPTARQWLLDFPPNARMPGTTLDTPPMIVMVQRLVALFLHGAPTRTRPPVPATQAPKFDDGGFAGVVDGVFTSLVDFVKKSEEELKACIEDFILHEIITHVEAEMLSFDSSSLDPETRLSLERFLYFGFLTQAVLHGIAKENLIHKGYDAIDRYEWSDWLYMNAVEVAKTQSPKWGDPAVRARNLIDWTPISSLYDYVFGYGDGGNTKIRSFAAGTALRSGFLLISYSGHFFWKMRGAMGDVVIAPVYLALKKRGVKFEFFARITDLSIDPTTDRLASIDYVRQVELKEPEKGYYPLIGVPIPGWPKDVPLEGWPAEPLWDQIRDGELHRSSGRDTEAEHNEEPGGGGRACRLEAGVDFDKAIIGISVGGLKQVCASFPERLPRSNWGPMFDAITLTRTCAMQLWMRRDMDDLGAVSAGRTLTGADQPYSSWSDMSHLLSRETWSGAEVPRSIIYFCGQIQGPQNGPPANIKAYDLAVSWLETNSDFYWPRAVSPTSPYNLDPDLIYDPDPGAPGDVLTRQYIRANCAPSDLYVQSPKDSVYTRMDAHQSGLENLFLAGDWTRNGINSGCAESAARSGYRCAMAVLGKLPELPT